MIRTNWNPPNFKLMSVADGLWNSRSQWNDLVPHNPAVLISGFELFDNLIALLLVYCITNTIRTILQ